jgi:hypothetical protein
MLQVAGDKMFNNDTSFAHYSKILCTIVALISLGVAILTFVSESPNAVLLGFLWLALSGVFCLSAWFVDNQGKYTGGKAGGRDSSE